jgi:hypothetical protein
MAQMVGTVEDLSTATRNIVDGAVAVTTGRLHLDSPEEASARILNEDVTALEYFRHELAHQIAMLLLRMDSEVIAVYKEHEIPEAEEFGTPSLRLNDPIHLVVYSQRETAALRSLIEAVDRSLVDVLSERCGSIAPGLIHADIIDDGVQARRVNASAGGFRPPPTKLVSREIEGTGNFDESHAL